MKQVFPTFEIRGLSTCNSSEELFSIDRFSKYIEGNPGTTKVHRHSFYHITYFVHGTGENLIDFKTYEITPEKIFFMRPGQVHSWKPKNNSEGYVMNFSPTFFEQISISSKLIDHFPFFNLFGSAQMVLLSESNQRKIKICFEDLITEISTTKSPSKIMIASLILQIFALANKEIPEENIIKKANYNSLVYEQFLKMVDDNYSYYKLPKDYAALLNITPNHLNFICKQQISFSAGEIIRNRIILEAKRLLVNFDLSVTNIAERLNYSDPSYFVKFFKKYTQVTPETFRKHYYNKY
ncbi:AraC family transcriptional regulator [Chryseobacterium balustinum]|uniref:AraC family transcriptional regulator n=1 Tax=Chryseobacterium balustinum TaxID=246 RepID=UPI003CE7DC7C